MTFVNSNNIRAWKKERDLAMPTHTLTRTAPGQSTNPRQPTAPGHAPRHPAAPRADSLRRLLALGAVAGPLLFTLAWIGFGVFQPPLLTPFGVLGGLSGAISNPISGLGVGPFANQFNTAFVVCGLLQAIGCVAALECLASGNRRLPRTVCDGLLAISPLGLAMAGVFTLASALVLHVVAGTLVFATPVVGFLATGLLLRGIPAHRRLGIGLLVASPLTLLLFVAYSMSFDQATVAAGLGIAGATERVLMLEVQAWYVAMGWIAFRQR
jgi:hypothetical membrane protein